MKAVSKLALMVGRHCLAVCLMACAATLGRAADVLLTLPFENVSGKAEYNWVGESFVVLYADLLETPGMRVIDPAERNAIYQRLGLRPSDILTRAAVIRVAETAQANLALVGTYDIGGDAQAATIAISARLIEIATGRLVGNKVFNLSGQLSDLQSMQGQLAWNILHERHHDTTISKDQLVTAAKAVSALAYESYVKAIQTPDAKVREQLLKRAIKEQVPYPQAIYELGLHYYRQREFLTAAEQFRQLEKADPDYLESQFYLGLAAHALGNMQEAASVYAPLAAALPLTDVLNNAGAFTTLAGDSKEGAALLRRAVVQTPTDARARFNLGYTLWKAGQFADAAAQLRTVATLQPGDGETLFLLARSLESAQQPAEATKYDEQAKKVFSNYARWMVAMDKIPSLYRLVTECNQAEILKYLQQVPANGQRAASQTAAPAVVAAAPQVVAASAPAGPSGPVGPVGTASLDRVRQLMQAGNDNEALSEVQHLVSSETTNAEAHYLRGTLLSKRGDQEGALSAWQSAVYWNPRHVAAHLALGKFYLNRNERALALTYARQVLQLDAQNREALALRQQIENGK